ncbi:integrase core domain-containing protein [Spirosoma gilvum]
MAKDQISEYYQLTNLKGGPAIAERVNGILKMDFRLNRVFVTFEEAEKAVEKSIYNYNHLRPHMNGPP